MLYLYANSKLVFISSARNPDFIVVFTYFSSCFQTMQRGVFTQLNVCRTLLTSSFVVLRICLFENTKSAGLKNHIVLRITRNSVRTALMHSTHYIFREYLKEINICKLTEDGAIALMRIFDTHWSIKFSLG